MNLKDKIRKSLRDVYGEFESGLELEYETVITENLLNEDFSIKEEWVTYNQVVLEFKHNLKDLLKVKQLQYELTDSRDPKDVCINLIRSSEIRSEELDRLYYKIRNFNTKKCYNL